jgi:cobalt-zinc-cadmium resistance protein CzcA
MVVSWLFVSGPGPEVQKPLAAVMIGGLITSTLMTLLVLPVYRKFETNNTSVIVQRYVSGVDLSVLLG